MGEGAGCAAHLRRVVPVEKDNQELAELTWVKGEYGDGAQHPGRWRDNSGGAYRGVSPAGEEADQDGIAPLEEVI